MKYNFKLVFIIPQNVVNIETRLNNSRKILSSINLRNAAINDNNNQGFTFDRIDEFNIITKADRKDMTYDF